MPRIPDSFAIGQDVARTNDKAAIVVLQKRGDTGQCVVRSAEIGVGIDLQAQAAAGVATIKALDAQIPGRDRLFYAIDRNGIGLGVAEDVYRRVRKDKSLGLRRFVKVVGLDAHGGTATNVDRKVSWWVNVSRDVITHRANAALREGSLVVTECEGSGADVLRQELSRLTLKSRAGGKQRVDHRNGEHDDVFMAMCYAFWLVSEFRVGGHVASSAKPMNQQIRTVPPDSQQAARVAVARPSAGETAGGRSRGSRGTAEVAALARAVAPVGHRPSSHGRALVTPRPVSAALDPVNATAADVVTLDLLAADGGWVRQSSLPASALGSLHRLRASGLVERHPADAAQWRAI